jgi:hypothetical protein
MLEQQQPTNVRIFHFYIFVNNEERVSFNFRLKLEDLKASKSPGPFKRVLCLWPILTVAINVQYAFCLSRRPPPPARLRQPADKH